MEILWRDEPPEHAASTLAKYVYRLRAVLEPGRSSGDPPQSLLTVAPGYLLQLEPGRLDAGRFSLGVSEARRQAASGDPALAFGLFDDALALWRGAALAEFADEDFARTEAARLEGLRVTALEDRAEVGLVLGRHRGADRRAGGYRRRLPVTGAAPRPADAGPLPKRPPSRGAAARTNPGAAI